jgi:NAD(P)H-hydrate epimerase
VGLIEDADVAQWVAQRKSDAHKGVAGHVLVLAGEQGRTGAALLSGTGALRTGAGLVTLAARGEGQRSLDTKVVELMTASLGDDDPVARALSLAQDKSAVVLGPGLGLDALGRELACRLAVELPRPAVLDADALTALGTDCARLRGVGHPRVLTPHPGEAARLLGSDTKDVQADRYAAAREIAQRSGAVTVLKGAGTVVAEPGGPARVCSAGTPAMAVAGTGDVLSGMIGALLSAGIAPWQAASAAVQLHARAGELAATGDRGMFASELAACVPEALCRCRAAVPQGAPDHDG